MPSQSVAMRILARLAEETDFMDDPNVDEVPPTYRSSCVIDMVSALWPSEGECSN